MKHQLITILFGIIALSYAATAGNANDVALATTATLRDGSTLKGTLLTDMVTGAAIFDNAIKLKAETIQFLSFTDTNGTAKVSLVNGDPNQNTEQNTKSPFLIDEFKIWNYAKTTFDLP